MNIHQCEPITIARGSALTPVYIFMNADGTKPDYSEFEAKFILSPYGFENENILSIDMHLDAYDEDGVMSKDRNRFLVHLNSDVTGNLPDGTYTVKVVLKDKYGNLYKYARGVFNVLKDTNALGETMGVM